MESSISLERDAPAIIHVVYPSGVNCHSRLAGSYQLAGNYQGRPLWKKDGGTDSVQIMNGLWTIVESESDRNETLHGSLYNDDAKACNSRCPPILDWSGFTPGVEEPPIAETKWKVGKQDPMHRKLVPGTQVDAYLRVDPD